MHSNREAVASALLALFTPLAPATFKTVSRAGKIWTEVEPADQPALFLIETGESDSAPQAWGANKYVLHYNLLIYARADSAPGTIAATLLNSLREAVDGVMQSAGEPQTLGGLVTNCWIEGDVMVDTGVLDQQCAVVIPVHAETGI